MRLRGWLWLLGALAPACSSEFPDEPAQAVVIEPLGWPSELAVTDVDTIEIGIRLRDSPQTITGLRVRWESSNEEVLRVSQLQPPAGASLEDTLLAQRRAEVTARSGGADTVHVFVGPGGAFEAAESSYVIQVTQKWVSVSAGRAHTCAITVDSIGYCWGEGDDGKLGNGRPVESAVPVPVVSVGDFRFIAMSAGDESSCGIIAEGVAYCWGRGEAGRLGNADPSERNQFVPVPVSGPSFQAIDVGPATCGVADDFTALCWGPNAEGHLGFNPLQSPGLDICLDGNRCSLAPRRVSFSDTTPALYLAVTVGDNHSCGLSHATQEGVAFCWGTGLEGALGNGTRTDSPTASRVASAQTFRAISAGGDHTCGIATTGGTLCWGANVDGQLGIGTTEASLIPTAVTSGSFIAVTVGGAHTCALTPNEEAFCWGMGSSGQLGNGSSERRLVPEPVGQALRFESLSAGELHTCGVARGGALYCWGEGSAGRLGTGSTEDQPLPTRVSEP